MLGAKSVPDGIDAPFRHCYDLDAFAELLNCRKWKMCTTKINEVRRDLCKWIVEATALDSPPFTLSRGQHGDANLCLRRCGLIWPYLKTVSSAGHSAKRTKHLFLKTYSARVHMVCKGVLIYTVIQLYILLQYEDHVSFWIDAKGWRKTTVTVLLRHNGASWVGITKLA